MTRRLMMAAALLLPLLGACDQQALTTAAPAGADAAAPTSVLDPATGEPVALNAPFAAAIPAGFSQVLEECDPFYEICECDPDAQLCPPKTCAELEDCPEPPCDSIATVGCEPCPRDNPAAWCYEPPPPPCSVIDTYSTVRTGDEPTATPEADGVGTGSSCGYLVLIGVGMRMSSNHDITTLHLKYQRVYTNGTLGPTELRKYGADPNHALEAYAEALPGEAIVGIGVGTQNTHNINTIRIWKRPIGLVSGAVRTSGSVTAESFGITPGGVLDTSHVISSSVADKVYVGFGARANSSEVRTAAHHIGTLR